MPFSESLESVKCQLSKIIEGNVELTFEENSSSSSNPLKFASIEFSKEDLWNNLTLVS